VFRTARIQPLDLLRLPVTRSTFTAEEVGTAVCEGVPGFVARQKANNLR
jgi:hypothetical protein